MSIQEKIGKYAYVPSHAQFFRNKGQYFARGAKTPQPGDVVIFQNESHIGYVEYVSGGYVHTVEGNTSGGSTLIANGGGVCQKAYSLTSAYIQGYGRPAYASGEAAKVLAIAKAEVGYLEKRSNAYLDDKTANAGSNNYNKFARDIWPSLQAQPWCDIFVSWCAIQADKGSSVSTTTTTKKVERYFYPWKTYKNGSTEEPVYKDSDLTTKTGSLNPYETCYCLGRYGSSYLVCYKIDGSGDNWAVGYVAYNGGITE